jgi:hypothetical protein
VLDFLEVSASSIGNKKEALKGNVLRGKPNPLKDTFRSILNPNYGARTHTKLAEGVRLSSPVPANDTPKTDTLARAYTLSKRRQANALT